LKQFFVILLSIVLLFPSFGTVIMYTTFKINQDEIAKTICVQRKFANNTCQGHCALKKSLKKLDENERKMETVLKGKIELIYIATRFEDNLLAHFDSNQNKLMVFHTTAKPISKITSTFRPPSFLV